MNNSGRATVFSALFLLSAATLAWEIILTRVFAITQFYHFAFLAVSLALLGFGASGSLLSIFPGWYENSSDQSRGDKLKLILAISGLGFTLSILLSYAIINWLPFDIIFYQYSLKSVFRFIVTTHSVLY